MDSLESPQLLSDIKSELSNFINLLQNTNPTIYNSFKSSGRLSIILSASEPESSSIDKQNSSQSANLSIKSSSFQTAEHSEIFPLIKQLQQSNLTKTQQKLLAEISFQVEDVIRKKQHSQSKASKLQQQLQRQKKGTDQLLQALVKLDEEQKDLWGTYYQLGDKFKQKSLDFDSVTKQNEELKKQIQNHKKELKFVKKLVYVANENYQQLEIKYAQLQQQIKKDTRYSLNKNVLALREKRSEQNLLTERSERSQLSQNQSYSPYANGKNMKAISPQYEISSSCSPMRKSSKSIKSRKSISPLQKDKQNIECNFKDVYRKMLMKNLKGQKKNGEF